MSKRAIVEFTRGNGHGYFSARAKIGGKIFYFELCPLAIVDVVEFGTTQFKDIRKLIIEIHDTKPKGRHFKVWNERPNYDEWSIKDKDGDDHAFIAEVDRALDYIATHTVKGKPKRNAHRTLYAVVWYEVP